MRLLRAAFIFLNTSFHAFYYVVIFLHIDYVQRSNTFATDLCISVTGAVVRDNSIKVMPDMAKRER